MAAHGINKNTPFWKKMLLSWTHSGAHHVGDWLNNWAFDPIAISPFAFIFIVYIARQIDPDAVTAVTAMTVGLSPLWLPAALFVFFWLQWMHYIRFAFWFSPICDSVLLEIQLPPEIEKTPLAMETFLVTLWNTGGETTFIQRIWKGQTRPVFALEIASNEGQVRFYLHTRKVWRNIVESRLYGQFPEARVTEVEDYARKVPFNLEEYGLWGAEYRKNVQPQALPIKTYVDFELNKAPDKPETQVDPITNIIELLGSIGPGEHFWFQMVLMGRKKDEWYGFYLNKDKYREEAKKGIADLTKVAIERAKQYTDDETEKKKVGSRGAMLMTEQEKLKVEAIERSMTKLTFEVGMRCLYLARRENFNGINNASIVRFFDTFNSSSGLDYNNRFGVTRGTSYFDYPWQDFNDARQNKEKRNLYFRYRHRAYFFVPYDQVPIWMSTEEIATLWHFPSSVVKSPMIDRVPAKVAGAPTNLPV